MGDSEEIRPTSAIGIGSAMRHPDEVRPRKDHRGFDLISDVLPFGRLWYGEANAIVNGLWLSLVERLVRDERLTNTPIYSHVL